MTSEQFLDAIMHDGMKKKSKHKKKKSCCSHLSSLTAALFHIIYTLYIWYLVLEGRINKRRRLPKGVIVYTYCSMMRRSILSYGVSKSLRRRVCAPRLRSLCTASVATNVFIPLNHRKYFRIEGKDTHTFLQGIITNDINQLQKRHDCLACALLNPKGRIVADLFVYNTSSDEDEQKVGVLYCCYCLCRRNCSRMSVVFLLCFIRYTILTCQCMPAECVD